MERQEMELHSAANTSRLYLDFDRLKATLRHATASYEIKILETSYTNEDYQIRAPGKTTHRDHFFCRPRETYLRAYNLSND
jgi:hypothetical protein